MKRRATITSVGRFLPDRILSNRDLEEMVDTSDQWIVDRTGIRERRLVEGGTGTSELAAAAAQEALDRRGIGANDVELIIVGTITPDMFFPSTACLVQEKLGARHAWGFDLSAACCGFLYSVSVAAQFIESGAHERVLVIGADVMSSIINYKDRATCVIFGDGAGAILLEPASGNDEGFLGFQHRVEGSGGRFLYMPAGGSAKPASHETVDQNLHFVHQDGRQVFKYAVRKTYETTTSLLAMHGLTADDISLLIAHQANVRILDATAERLGLPPEKIVKNIDKLGNTTAATIPLALYDAVEDQRLHKGDLVLFSSVGAGFTSGASLLRWSGLRTNGGR
ncbi:MAG TPA: beta-ketoacyl-ACP synthase III [Vicinamibacteria bacterium]|nr:beta-ketoacyl-ACP synthase III [Vicinamibacteria bacterium]